MQHESECRNWPTHSDYHGVSHQWHPEVQDWRQFGNLERCLNHWLFPTLLYFFHDSHDYFLSKHHLKLGYFCKNKTKKERIETRQHQTLLISIDLIWISVAELHSWNVKRKSTELTMTDWCDSNWLTRGALLRCHRTSFILDSLTKHSIAPTIQNN